MDDQTVTIEETWGAMKELVEIGHGFLTGEIRSIEDVDPGDFRRHKPRFQGENFIKT